MELRFSIQTAAPRTQTITPRLSSYMAAPTTGVSQQLNHVGTDGNFFTATFIPLHDFAHKANLRVVAWNRRDYRGSTKYTDDELADLTAGRQVFQERLAFQLASFLEHFIKTKDTPILAPDRKTGGFLIMGWSFGNATALSLLSNPNAIPGPLYELIVPYVMGLVLYGLFSFIRFQPARLNYHV
jgi:pimeloyl-ACP methyl ester carboxylesterase